MNALRALEQAVLAEGREWTRRRLETQLQAQANALPAQCPQSGQPLVGTRWRSLRRRRRNPRCTGSPPGKTQEQRANPHF